MSAEVVDDLGGMVVSDHGDGIVWEEPPLYKRRARSVRRNLLNEMLIKIAKRRGESARVRTFVPKTDDEKGRQRMIRYCQAEAYKLRARLKKKPGRPGRQEPNDPVPRGDWEVTASPLKNDPTRWGIYVRYGSKADAK